MDEKYWVPRIEDIFAEMSCGKIFCTFDISNCYLHIMLDEESSIMQTLTQIITKTGLITNTNF